MNLELGKAIKRLRIEKGITQEELAGYVNISYQAVSKWENNVTMPDITLLPKIAVFFGVTIDDLFSVTDSDHFERIDYMLEHEHTISDENFIYTKRFLDSLLKENENDSEALKRYAMLYMHRVNRETLTAGRYLEKALYNAPYNNEIVNFLIQLRENRQEHNRVIKFFEDFLIKYPSQDYIKEMLVKLYIKIRYFDKAKQIVNELRSDNDKPAYSFYESDIEFVLGNTETAYNIWHDIAERYKDFKCYYEAGERFDKANKYDEAINYYELAFSTQSKPRNLSSIYSLAFLYDRLNQPQKAIEMWELIIEVIKSDYDENSTDIEWPLDEIRRLKNFVLCNGL